MAKKKSTKKENQTNVESTPEIENKEELVNFVANNILNSITLNQVVTLVQQVSLRDANTIVTQADEAKLKEIQGAYTATQEQAQKNAQQQTEASEPAPAWSIKMQKIKLCITSRSENGSVHGNLKINGSDSGVLYLQAEELKFLTKIISAGIAQQDDFIDFSVDDNLECVNEIDEDPWAG